MQKNPFFPSPSNKINSVASWVKNHGGVRAESGFQIGVTSREIREDEEERYARERHEARRDERRRRKII